MSSDNEFEDTYDDESPVVAEKHTRGGRRRAPGGGGGGGMFEVNVSAGGRPEMYQVREPATTTNAREVLFTHCGLKVHSHYSV